MTPREQWSLPGRLIGRRVLVFDRLDSTSDRVAELAVDPANEGVAVLADEQTAGRGQYGRTWTTPPRSSVLLSLLLFPPPELRRPALLTAWAAVAVCATVRQVTGLEARIKWPNDILVHGSKTCGILIEQGRGGTVVGIGLNVRQSRADFEAAGLLEATALAEFTAEAPDTYAVARLLLEHLDRSWETLRAGERMPLETAWRNHIGLLGQRVRAECHEGVIVGRLRSMTFDGIEVEEEGRGVVLQPERIKHLAAAI